MHPSRIDCLSHNVKLFIISEAYFIFLDLAVSCKHMAKVAHTKLCCKNYITHHHFQFVLYNDTHKMGGGCFLLPYLNVLFDRKSTARNLISGEIISEILPSRCSSIF